MTDATPDEPLDDSANEPTASPTPPRSAGLPPALAGAYADILRANMPTNAVLELVRNTVSNPAIDAAREAMRYAAPVPTDYLDIIKSSLPAINAAHDVVRHAVPLHDLPGYQAAREALAASAPPWTDIITEQARLLDATSSAQIDLTPSQAVFPTARPDYTLGSVEEIDPPDTTVPDLLADVSNHLANIVARTEADAMANEAAQARAHRATLTSNIVAIIGLVIGAAALVVAIAYH